MKTDVSNKLYIRAILATTYAVLDIHLCRTARDCRLLFGPLGDEIWANEGRTAIRTSSFIAIGVSCNMEISRPWGNKPRR